MKKSFLFFIVCCNQEALTKECLAKFPKSTQVSYDILLFDNGSQKSLKRLTQQYPNILFKRSAKNLGYAGAVQWLQESKLYQKYFYVVIMNNDVFFSPQFFPQLANLQNRQQLPDVFQPVLYEDANHEIIENAGIRFYQSGLAFQRSSLSSLPSALNGACLFISGEVIEYFSHIKQDIFITELWSYCEDLEFTLRAQAHGFSCKIVDTLKAQHLGSQSFGRQSDRARRFYYRNTLWLWLTVVQHTLFASLLFTFSQVVVFLSFLLQGKGKLYASIWQEGIRNRTVRQKLHDYWPSVRKAAVQQKIYFGLGWLFLWREKKKANQQTTK